MKRALLYTMEGNADGEAALAFLQSRGVAVDVRDVGRDPDASLDLFKRIGRLTVPAVVIDERVFLGFGPHRDEIDALVREGAARRLGGVRAPAGGDMIAS